jgi:hypothetical protein
MYRMPKYESGGWKGGGGLGQGSLKMRTGKTMGLPMGRGKLTRHAIGLFQRIGVFF